MSLSTITTTLKYSVSSSKGSSHDSRYDDTEHFNSSGIKNSTKLLSRKDYTILKKYDNKEDFILRGLKNSFPPCRTNDGKFRILIVTNYCGDEESQKSQLLTTCHLSFFLSGPSPNRCPWIHHARSRIPRGY